MTFEEWLEACPGGKATLMQHQGSVLDIDRREVLFDYVAIEREPLVVTVNEAGKAMLARFGINAPEVECEIMPVDEYSATFAEQNPVPPPAWGVASGPWPADIPPGTVTNHRLRLYRTWEQNDWKPKPLKCECGTDACGGGQHDEWCPKYSADRY